MNDIIIYTTPGILEHKKRNGRADHRKFCYWKFHNFPKKIPDNWSGTKIYFATKGFIRGYFVLFDMSLMNRDTDELTWHSESWKDIEPIPIKPFRGFKYYKK